MTESGILNEILKNNTVSSQHRSIERAQKVKNPLEPFADEFGKFGQNDCNLTLYCKWKSEMDTKTLKWAFKLAERNVGPFYKTCVIGWQPKVKQADLNKQWARYIVAVDPKTKSPIGYTMFRFDMDYGSSVVYCYELQIEKEYQRKGLGRFLIAALEKIARHNKMEKLILTVLVNNEDSVKFFNDMGFVMDENSPDESENAGYNILCKILQ